LPSADTDSQPSKQNPRPKATRQHTAAICCNTFGRLQRAKAFGAANPPKTKCPQNIRRFHPPMWPIYHLSFAFCMCLSSLKASAPVRPNRFSTGQTLKIDLEGDQKTDRKIGPNFQPKRCAYKQSIRIKGATKCTASVYYYILLQ